MITAHFSKLKTLMPRVIIEPAYSIDASAYPGQGSIWNQDPSASTAPWIHRPVLHGCVWTCLSKEATNILGDSQMLSPQTIVCYYQGLDP